MTERNKGTVFSVGHGARHTDELVELLVWAGVEVVADVRRHPHSHHHPWFSRDLLAGSLHDAGLEYVPLGDDLGGFRRGGYERHAGTAAFERGLEALEDIAHERPTAFLCAETVPERCHRLVIARELERRGWEVRHLLAVGRDWEPPHAPEQLPLF